LAGLIDKKRLPATVRYALRAILNYVQRLGRWLVILWQVRGVGWRDEWALIRSALAAPVISLRDPGRWQDPILLTDAQVRVRGVGRFALRARSDDLYHVLPWRERRLVEFADRFLQPGDVFVDAGANIGFFSIQAGHLVGETGRVIAFEMMTENAARLAMNAGLNKLRNITLHQCALSESDKQHVRGTMSVGKFGQASITREAGPADLVMEVETISLDTALDGIETVRLLKMDIEGAEELAVRGALAALQRTECIIYERRPALVDGDPVGALLTMAGFSVRQLDRANMIAERVADRVREAGSSHRRALSRDAR
jgi:FkbM family methyltransferase